MSKNPEPKGEEVSGENLRTATPCDFFLWGYVKDQVYVPPLPAKYPGTEGTNQNRH